VARVALVFPYYRTRSATELLLAPLGPAALAAQLRRLGLDARVFDGTFRSEAWLAHELRAYAPDITGISSMVSLTRNTLRVAELTRVEAPRSLLVAGGPLPTVFPERYAAHVDVVFRGESDLSFPRFCADVLAPGRGTSSLDQLPLASYPGLFIARNGLRVDNPAAHHSQRELAAFPPPDRSDFDHAAYQKEWRRRTGTAVTSIILSYGCPYGCEFCSKPVFGAEVRRRDLDAVFDEIDQLRALGYDGLWIADDTFTLDARYLEEFCRRIARRRMSWSCLSRADAVTADAARLMKSAGCRRVYLGLESGSDATLRLMNKRLTVEQGRRATRLYCEAGIEVAAFFIVGYPGESEAAIEQTFALALELPLDEISFNVPMPLPGSALYERLGRPDEGRDWTRENELTFVFPSQVDQAWLRRRVDETMRAFAAKRRRTPAPERHGRAGRPAARGR